MIELLGYVVGFAIGVYVMYIYIAKPLLSGIKAKLTNK